MPVSPRELAAVEEKVAWCIAVHGPRELVERLRAALADGQLELVEKAADAMLPRANVRLREPSRPVRDGDDVRFDNGLVQASFNQGGALLELASPRTRVPLAQANLLAAYRDFPKGWRVRVRPTGFEMHDDRVEVRFLAGSSPATMSIEVRRGEPFVRVTCAIDWKTSSATLTLENWVAIQAAGVRHGADRHFAALSDERAGLALFVDDPRSWTSQALRKGGMHLRVSLLHDGGPKQLAWAFAPFEPGISLGALEAAYEEFACEPRVRLFTSEDPSVRVVACGPAADGDGVIVTAREYDGAARPLRLRCGARMREVEGEAAIEGEAIVSDIDAFGEREFRVRF
ncbi:MAG: hypothetical protein WA629_08620 [Candidatus Aquilonibacter sp.]